MDKNIRPLSLNRVNYSNGKFLYPWGKLYSEFPTLQAVQSGKFSTLSRGALGVSLDSPIITDRCSYTYNTIQYNTIQYNTIQYNTIQYNTIQYNTIQYNTIQYNTIQYNTIHYNTIQYNTILMFIQVTPHHCSGC